MEDGCGTLDRTAGGVFKIEAGTRVGLDAGVAELLGQLLGLAAGRHYGGQRCWFAGRRAGTIRPVARRLRGCLFLRCRVVIGRRGAVEDGHVIPALRGRSARGQARHGDEQHRRPPAAPE